MKHTITFTPETICNHLNDRFDENFTVERIIENWDGIINYLENWTTSGLMGDNLWEDFMSVAEEWEIDLFDEDYYQD
jgi:hypothetical protein